MFKAINALNLTHLWLSKKVLAYFRNKPDWMKTRRKIGFWIEIILFFFWKIKIVIFEFYFKKCYAELRWWSGAIGMTTFSVASAFVFFVFAVWMIHVLATIHFFSIRRRHFFIATRFFWFHFTRISQRWNQEETNRNNQ